VARARLYATALGAYEASINGARVGALHFTPGWTDFTKRVMVQTYDVTSNLTLGENVLGVILGDGWYHGNIGDGGGRGLYQAEGPIRALAQLEIELTDGTRQVIGTDGAWDSTNGPIIASDTMDGEIYDARREMPGWNAPGFTENQWVSAAPVTGVPVPSLVAQIDDGVGVDTPIVPVSVQPNQGVFVYDLGQNISGWARLSVQGPAGAALTLRFAEVLNPDGSIYTANLRTALATERYTLSGHGTETYEPRFTSHGFRYVELSGDTAMLGAAPTLATVTGIPVHAATPVAGTLTTSDPVLNQLQSNVSWSQKDNFTVVPTDCPQRDERMGWMGDAQIFARTATFNMDVAAYYTQWLKDVDEVQNASGAFTNVSPDPHDFIGADGTPAWGDAGVIIPWTVYLAYGDTRILAAHYPAMVKWVDYIASVATNNLWESSRGSDYGDWLSWNSSTDKAVLGTAFYAHSTDIVSKVAQILGNAADQAKYSQLFASIVSAFNAAYVTADGHIQGDTQTTYALALQFGLLPAALQPKVAALLQADIQAHGGYLTTGFLGVGYLLPALSSAGMTPVAYGLLSNTGLPSWRYEIANGATTTWERWDGIQANGTFEDPSMNSFNHYSFGSVDEWMYETIGGLVLDEASPGWKSFAVRPVPGGGLTSGKATLDSPYGLIVSDWSIASGTFTLKATVPVNSAATVYLPYTTNVMLDGALPPAPGAGGGYAVGSGTYVFTASTQ
jgi:alpha-L-rhamnosidase